MPIYNIQTMTRMELYCKEKIGMFCAAGQTHEKRLVLFWNRQNWQLFRFLSVLSGFQPIRMAFFTICWQNSVCCYHLSVL